MITETDKAAIIDLATRYQVGKILLFGSSADPARSAQDIDLAVEGIKPELFFKFYGDLIFSLSSPVDVVDLSADTKFNRIIRREGIHLYG